MAVITYKCKNCGAELQFNPQTQNYVCEYCGTEYSLAEIEAANPDAAQAMEKPAEKEEKVEQNEEGFYVYSCPSCGAEIVVDGTTSATKCFYCHNPILLSGRLSGEYMPDSVVPFKISREEARRKFQEELAKRKYMPDGIFDTGEMEDLTGVYFPYWVYKGTLNGQFRANGKKIRTWTSGDFEYIETSIFRVERDGQLEMDGLSRNALKKADRDLIECVLPYPISERVPFHMSYLSGFQAEKRDVEKHAVANEICKERDQIARNVLQQKADGYVSLEGQNVSIRALKEEWEYVLLPVWLVTAPAADGKIYYYAMNGQTGKMNGEFPVSNRKIGIRAAISGALVAAAVLIGGFLL